MTTSRPDQTRWAGVGSTVDADFDLSIEIDVVGPGLQVHRRHFNKGFHVVAVDVVLIGAPRDRNAAPPVGEIDGGNIDFGGDKVHHNAFHRIEPCLRDVDQGTVVDLAAERDFSESRACEQTKSRTQKRAHRRLRVCTHRIAASTRSSQWGLWCGLAESFLKKRNAGTRGAFLVCVVAGRRIGNALVVPSELVQMGSQKRIRPDEKARAEFEPEPVCGFRAGPRPNDLGIAASFGREPLLLDCPAMLCQPPAQLWRIVLRMEDHYLGARAGLQDPSDGACAHSGDDGHIDASKRPKAVGHHPGDVPPAHQMRGPFSGNGTHRRGDVAMVRANVDHDRG